VKTLQLRVEQLEQQVQTMAARSLAAVTSTAAASAHRLHKDALHCVLVFLSLKELPAAMRSCRAWYAAVHSLPLQNALLYVCSARLLYRLPLSASSPLIRHIVNCDFRIAGITTTADELAQFLVRLPRLQSLSHSACRSLNLHPQLYSSQLRELDVDLFISGGGDAPAVQMANLSSATGLHRLTLSFPLSYSQHLSLASLECMLELESLTLRRCSVIPPAGLLPIRRLPFLRTLWICDWDDENEQLGMLVEERADCPSLQLHSFVTADQVDLKRAKLLIHVTTLQRVEPARITPDALKVLAHGLPDLRTIKIDLSPYWPDPPQVDDWPMVCEGLAACHQLTTLTLVSTPVKELAALLLALPPSVRKLDIRDCDGFLHSDSVFHCVAEGGLRQLERLQVQLVWRERDNEKVKTWLERFRACAPWVKAMIEV
jgi:hypothetical protein